MQRGLLCSNRGGMLDSSPLASPTATKLGKVPDSLSPMAKLGDALTVDPNLVFLTGRLGVTGVPGAEAAIS
jgi:hypothetical protein